MWNTGRSGIAPGMHARLSLAAPGARLACRACLALASRRASGIDPALDRAHIRGSGFQLLAWSAPFNNTFTAARRCDSSGVLSHACMDSARRMANNSQRGRRPTISSACKYVIFCPFQALVNMKTRRLWPTAWSAITISRAALRVPPHSMHVSHVAFLPPSADAGQVVSPGCLSTPTDTLKTRIPNRLACAASSMLSALAITNGAQAAWSKLTDCHWCE